MKKIIVAVLALGLAFSTTGCISGFKGTVKRTTETLKPDGTLIEVTEELTESMVYNEQAGLHARYESERISNQAEAIKDNIKDSGISKDATALLIYLSNEQIASMHPAEFKGSRPMTVTEGVVELAKVAGGVVSDAAPYAAAYGAVKAVADMKQGNTTVVSGDGNEVSTNAEENHATNIGHDNLANTNSPGGEANEKDVGAVPADLWNECTEGATLGEAAGCFAMNGYDVEIKGGLAYLDGEPWDELNDWEADK